MASSSFSMNVNTSQPIPILIGNTQSFTLTFQNSSPTDRLYNLTIKLTIPYGLSLSASTITQTSAVTNSDSSTTYSFVNIKDMAPEEMPYVFSVTLKCGTKFTNGTAIPFGYLFSTLQVQGQMDTMPRGIYDVGNTVLTASASPSFTTTMFNGLITTAGKVLKGAGSSPLANDYTQTSTATCSITNNSLQASTVNIVLLLDDGIRYIGNLKAAGTDAALLTNPVISYVQINNKYYTQILYSGVTLSISSSTSIVFTYAIWNKYNNNQGAMIAHKTPLNMTTTITTITSTNPVTPTYSSTNTTAFLAMDIIITTSIKKSIVDVQNTLSYSFAFSVGGYYDLSSILVHYYLPDGIQYLSGSFIPASVENSLSYDGFYITYSFPSEGKNSITTGTIGAKVNSYYTYLLNPDSSAAPVVGFDSFIAAADITALTIQSNMTITDNAGVGCSINTGTIVKQFVKGYYQNGVAKTISALAPLDFAEYLLSYNASSIYAQQKAIYIDDYFPLSASPITDLTYHYTGLSPITSPNLISPHGIDFSYGDIPGHTAFTIDYEVPISQVLPSAENANLMKLKGMNTAGIAYSNRSQVNFNIGAPNLQLTKTVSGPNISAIKANEVYTYTIKLSNTNTLKTETDAFYFTLSDTLSGWFTVNPASIQISGSGIYRDYQLSPSSLTVAVTSLAPGQSIVLSYSVTIINTLAPGVRILTTATNTLPYAQPYTDTTPNYQYTGLSKSASATISSQGIALTKTTNNDTFQVGSTIVYTVTLTVPQGTTAYGLYVKDSLSSGNQSYIGPCYRNGLLITPTVSSSTITFPTEGTIDATAAAQTLAYIFYCKIIAGTKSINAATTVQNNTVSCYYQQIAGGILTTVSKTINVTINHPNIVLLLSGADQTNSISSSTTLNTGSTSKLLISLHFQNNSAVALVNCTIQIPMSPNYNFSSIITTANCVASYVAATRLLTITINELDSSMSGLCNFMILPILGLSAGAADALQAKAISYYNNISKTKIYSGETSNVLTLQTSPGVTLLPDPLTQINSSTSFIVTKPGTTAVINDYFTNSGGGYDSFSISIDKVAISYSLYINDIFVAMVPANTAYGATPALLSNLKPGTQLVITIHAPIPITSGLGAGYNFLVTATSLTSPHPTQSVLNIDPNV